MSTAVLAPCTAAANLQNYKYGVKLGEALLPVQLPLLPAYLLPPRA